MRILYIHQYFNTPSMPGSTRSYEFAKRLVSRGDKVYMVTTNWQGASNSSYSHIDGINVYWSPIRYTNKMNYFKRLFVFAGFMAFVLLAYFGIKGTDEAIDFQNRLWKEEQWRKRNNK